jgi:hypothetical protein
MNPVDDSRLNELPKRLDANTLKMWQYKCLADTAAHIVERSRMKTLDRNAVLMVDYIKKAKEVIEINADKLPVLPMPLTKDMLMRQFLGNANSEFTEKKLWSYWGNLTHEMVAVMLPQWIEVAPRELPSGKTSWEPILLEFRKRLFDLKHNSISKYIEKKAEKDGVRVPVQAVSSSTAATAEGDDEDDGDDEEDVLPTQPLPIPKKKRGRKPKVAGEKVPFKADWFPPEWLAFVHHGPLAEKPYYGWLQTKNGNTQGPNEGNDDEMNTKALSRKIERKRIRDEKRDEASLIFSPNSASSELSTSLGGEKIGEEITVLTSLHTEFERANTIQEIQLKVQVLQVQLTYAVTQEAKDTILNKLNILTKDLV